MKKVFINGQFVDPDKANISIFDRGLLFGDGVYEVLPVYQGKAYFLDRHITRLNNSLAESRINRPSYDWAEICQQLIELNDDNTHQIYIQITRGNQGQRRHDIPENLSPTVIAFTLQVPFPKPSDKEKGLKAQLLEDDRWLNCHIKSTSLLANILLNDEAVSQGANTAILLREGYLTEGSTSNIFIVDEHNKVRTPPLNHLCLAGITRQIVIELLEKLNVQVIEDSNITKDDILSAKEVWLTSTTKELFPVSVINDQRIGTDNEKALWKEVDTLYQQMVAES